MVICTLCLVVLQQLLLHKLRPHATLRRFDSADYNVRAWPQLMHQQCQHVVYGMMETSSCHNLCFRSAVEARAANTKQGGRTEGVTKPIVYLVTRQ